MIYPSTCSRRLTKHSAKIREDSSPLCIAFCRSSMLASSMTTPWQSCIGNRLGEFVAACGGNWNGSGSIKTCMSIVLPLYNSPSLPVDLDRNATAVVEHSSDNRKKADNFDIAECAGESCSLNVVVLELSEVFSYRRSLVVPA